VKHPTPDMPEAHLVEAESNLINGYAARPAILDLTGAAAGRLFVSVDHPFAAQARSGTALGGSYAQVGGVAHQPPANRSSPRSQDPY
jgi:hypothetical protein